MTLDPRVRKSLPLIALALAAALVVSLWPRNSAPATLVAPAAVSEKRLARLRESAATVPARQEILKSVTGELAAREKGLLTADTAPQAQAQLIQIFREVGRAENPPVEIRSTDAFGIRPLGDAYGEATVGVQVECRIDQLVNILAGLAERKELVSTGDLRINSTGAKEKTVNVRLTLAGVVPRKLVPEKSAPGRRS